MQLTASEENRIKPKTNITIRPIIIQDKEKLFHLIRQRGTFNEKEIEVAIEVIEDTLAFPEKKEYYTFCALEGNGRYCWVYLFWPHPHDRQMLRPLLDCGRRKIFPEWHWQKTP